MNKDTGCELQTVYGEKKKPQGLKQFNRNPDKVRRRQAEYSRTTQRHLFRRGGGSYGWRVVVLACKQQNVDAAMREV